MRWGIRYMAPEGATAGSGGTAVNVISANHERFKSLLDDMESRGVIDAKPNEGVNLDTPLGKDPPLRSTPAATTAAATQQQPQQPVEAQQSASRQADDDSSQDSLDGSGVDAEQSSGSDTSGEATPEVQSRHSDDMVRIAASYGLSRAVVERLDDEALRMTLRDLAERQSFRPPLREAQQVPQLYPQQAQQSQASQFQQAPQQAPQVDLRAKLEQMKQSGDYDAKDLELFEGVVRESEDAKRLAMQASQFIQQQQQYEAYRRAEEQRKYADALDVMIDQLQQPEVYGRDVDFRTTPFEKWTEGMKQQGARAAALKSRVDFYQERGIPLTPKLVEQAHVELFGAVKAAEKKATAQRVVNQSRSRMGSSNQPGRGNGGTWSGPPGQDPELQDFFNSRQLANRGY